MFTVTTINLENVFLTWFLLLIACFRTCCIQKNIVEQIAISYFIVYLAERNFSDLVIVYYIHNFVYFVFCLLEYLSKIKIFIIITMFLYISVKLLRYHLSLKLYFTIVFFCNSFKSFSVFIITIIERNGKSTWFYLQYIEVKWKFSVVSNKTL